MTVARLLGRAVVHRDLNVGEAARQLGLTRPSLSNVLNGHAKLSIPLALQFENKFGLAARDLLIQQLDEQLADARRKRKRMKP